MLTAIKNLVSPKMIQTINISIYDSIKISLLMGIFSFPWALVNSLLKFTPGTFLFYVLGIGFFLPNIIASTSLLDKSEEVTFKAYFKEWKDSWKKNGKVTLFISGVLSFWIVDSYVVVTLMKNSFLFPVLYITMMFLSIAAVYLILLRSDDYFLKYSFGKQLKIAAFHSWRYAGTTLLAFMILMLWLSISYFLQGLALIIGNGITWTTITKLLMRNVKKTFR